MADAFDLDRFLTAQDGGVYEQALAEIRAGRKQSHWMWFIFPQHRDLGRSETSRFFGLAGIDEARAYLAKPMLRRRLLDASAAMLAQLRDGRRAADVLGEVDALKLASSMAIFHAAAPDEPIFRQLLDHLA